MVALRRRVVGTSVHVVVCVCVIVCGLGNV